MSHSAMARPVQQWFDGLPDDAKSEIAYLLAQMQNVTRSLWRRPEFDPLIGAGGISEIRVPDIRHSEGLICYRIYGYFGPQAREYTLLHGTHKDVKNDVDGKATAKKRLDQIADGSAGVHKFNF